MTNPAPKKFRVSTWLDLSAGDGSPNMRWGVQAHIDGAWRHVSSAGVALFFNTRAEAEERVKKLRADIKKKGSGRDEG